MKLYIQPYEGEKPYLFFSYCHKDAPEVYPVIERLMIDGFRIWYDDGLHPGDDWPEVIAEHLHSSDACIVAVSEEYSRSHNCKNELTFAVNHNKPIVSVILNQFIMARGLSLQIGSSNYINYYEFSDNPDAFYTKLESCSALSSCRNKDHLTDQHALSAWKKHIPEYRMQEMKASNPKPDLFQKLTIEIDTPTENSETSLAAKTGSQEDNEKTVITNRSHQGEEDDLEKTILTGSGYRNSEGEEDTLERTVARKPRVIPTIALVVHRRTGSAFRMKTDEISIGKDQKQSDFVISSPYISKRHADIISKEGNFYLKDNDSTNGTFYAGRKLGEDPEEKPVQLGAFDSFSLDEEQFLFAYGDSMKQVLQMEKYGFFSSLKALETGEEKLLGTDVFNLSRTDTWQNGIMTGKQVSRKHASIFLKEDGYYIRDIGSANGTFVNDVLLKQGEEHKLADADIIRIADVQFCFSVHPLNLPESEEVKS